MELGTCPRCATPYTSSEITGFGGPDAAGIALISGGPCNLADVAEPFGLLDFFDVAAFLDEELQAH